MMYIQGSKVQSAFSKDADMLIIGAGPAGITLATTLARQGKNVLLAEAGSERFNTEIQKQYRCDKVTAFYPDPTKSRLRQLGGTSNHWANNTSRFSPIDFEEREWLTVPGWPIKLHDIEPFYTQAEHLCGVGDDGYSFLDAQKTYGFENPVTKNNPFIEMAVARAAIPPTRFYEKLKVEISTSENLTLLDRAELTSLIWERESQTVQGANFHVNGHLCTVHAKKVILCLGGIENARALLIENEKHNNALGNQGDSVGRYFMDHPTLPAANLFSNNDDLYQKIKGRLHHDYSQFVVAFYQLSESTLKKHNVSNIRMPLERSTRMEMSEGISSLHSLRQILTGNTSPRYALQHLSQAALEWDLIGQAAINKLNGPQIIKDADSLSGYQINMMMEQSPDHKSRITLSSKKDALGRNLANVEWRLTEKDIDRFWRGLELFAHGIALDGVGRVKLLKHQASRLFTDQMGFGHHHCGSTRMSDSPEFGVVDKDLKVHGTANLFVCGSSVFSTGSHVPPTLTITALALRLAKHLSKGEMS